MCIHVFLPFRYVLFRVCLRRRDSLETSDVIRVVEFFELEASESTIDVLLSTSLCCCSMNVWCVVARVCAVMPW